MKWQDVYKERTTDIDTAVSLIQSGNDVIVAQCASEPQGCMSRFHIVGDRVEDVRVFSVLTLRPYDFYMKPAMKGHFELASWFHAPGSREALKAGTGTVTYVPNMLHRAATDRIQARRPDIFFGTCTPPDRHGFVSLSLGITYEKDIIEAAKTVVLEVNPACPAPSATRTLHVSAVDRLRRERPGGARAARALPDAHGPRHRRPRRRARRGRLDDPARHRRHPQRGRPRLAGQAGPRACTPR